MRLSGNLGRGYVVLLDGVRINEYFQYKSGEKPRQNRPEISLSTYSAKWSFPLLGGGARPTAAGFR
jgi:hypothetical protein